MKLLEETFKNPTMGCNWWITALENTNKGNMLIHNDLFSAVLGAYSIISNPQKGKRLVIRGGIPILITSAHCFQLYLSGQLC